MFSSAPTKSPGWVKLTQSPSAAAASGSPESCAGGCASHGHHSPLQRGAHPLQLLPHSRESHWWGEYRIEKYSSCAAVPSTSPSARFSQTPLSGALHSCSYAESTCQPGVTGESAWSRMPHHFWLHPHLKVQPFRHEMCFTFVWPLPVFFSACFDVMAVSARFVLSAQALKQCSYLHLFLSWNVAA